MRQGSAVSYLYGDHLGSTSLVTDASGAALTETRDPLTRAGQPYGQAYWQWGATRTDFGFTPSGKNTLRVQAGQRLDGFGLMDYNARYYSSTLGRFISPDSIIPQPGSPLAWDRYGYVNSNPVRYTDPSGHMLDDGCHLSGCTGDPNAIIHIIYMGGFPAIPKPNAVNFAEKAENSFDPQGRLDPSAGVSLVNDLMEQIMIYKYSHDPDEIHAYLKYEENKDGSIEITTLELWNKSNRHASVGSVLIYAYNNPCNLSKRPDYAYKVVAPRIGKHNSGLGVVSPNNRRDIPLTPSGDQNPTNLFAGDSSVSVAATFYLYFPQYDTKYLYTALTTSIAQ